MASHDGERPLDGGGREAAHPEKDRAQHEEEEGERGRRQHTAHVENPERHVQDAVHHICAQPDTLQG